MRVGPLFAGKLLGQPALQPQRRQLGGEFDDDDRIGETAKRLRAVHPPGDEQERQARGEAQQKAEEVGPSPFGKRGEIAHSLSCPASRARAVFQPTLSLPITVYSAITAMVSSPTPRRSEARRVGKECVSTCRSRRGQ